MEKQGTTERLLNEILETRVNVTLGDLVQSSPVLAEKLRKALTRRRLKPGRLNGQIDVLQQECVFPYMEDDIEIRLQHDAVNVDKLPVVDSFYISTEEDTAFDPRVKAGHIVVPVA